MATEKQIRFMQKLASERLATNKAGEVDPEGRTVAQVIGDAPGYWAYLAELPVQEISEKIDRLMAAPKAPRPQVADDPEVPAGHYAVESRTGNNDLDFYRVDRPTEGKWAGRIFVKRVIGGHADTPIRGAEAREALAAIAADPEAGPRYGKEVGQCYRCNRHLTDETSRALGIGPECRKQVA